MNISKVKEINKELGFKKGYEWKQNKRLTKDFLTFNAHGATYRKSYIEGYLTGFTSSLYLPELPKYLTEKIKPETDKIKEDILRDRCLNIYKNNRAEFKEVEAFYTFTIDLDKEVVPDLAGYQSFFNREHGGVFLAISVCPIAAINTPDQFAFFASGSINPILSWHPYSKFFVYSFTGYKNKKGYVLVAISTEGKMVGSIKSIGFKFSEENLSPITEYFTPEDPIKGETKTEKLIRIFDAHEVKTAKKDYKFHSVNFKFDKVNINYKPMTDKFWDRDTGKHILTSTRTLIEEKLTEKAIKSQTTAAGVKCEQQDWERNTGAYAARVDHRQGVTNYTPSSLVYSPQYIKGYKHEMALVIERDGIKRRPI